MMLPLPRVPESQVTLGLPKQEGNNLPTNRLGGFACLFAIAHV